MVGATFVLGSALHDYFRSWWLDIPGSVCACGQSDINNKWDCIFYDSKNWHEIYSDWKGPFNFTHFHFTSEFAEGHRV